MRVAYTIATGLVYAVGGKNGENYWFENGVYKEHPRLFDSFKDACTSIVVGRKASLTMSPMSSHSNDCADCDIRMADVPAKDHAVGSMRGINNDVPHLYPRRVEYGRASIYEPSQDQPILKEYLGYIPEVSHTYALYESSYPLINEHGLAMGESTTEAKMILANARVDQLDPGTNKTTNGTALILVSQAMQIALERCKTALCAVHTMGEILETYGFAGEAYGASEAVSIVDTTDAYVFEVAGDGNGSAIWVARRVPEDHVAVIANSIIIREIDFDDTENFIVSKNLLPTLERLGLYNSTAGVAPKLDYAKVVAAGLQNLSWYDTLRRWRIYDRIAPSLGLKPTDDPDLLPFSVKPDKPLSAEDVMNLFRDHYEGTEFDMREGLFAMPHGNPNVELTGRDFLNKPGIIPRAISLHRTAYTSIVAPEKGLFSKVWFGVDAPASSVFVPFYAEALKSPNGGTVSHRYETGIQKQFDRASANWAFNFVANHMNINYQNMSMEYVYPKRDELQRFVLDSVADIESKLRTINNKTETSIALAQFQTEVQEHVVSSWWTLADLLVVRYNDGYFNFPEWAPNSVKIIDMPAWFMDMIGFNDNFLRPTQHWFVPFTGSKESALEFGKVNGPLSASSNLGELDSNPKSFNTNTSYGNPIAISVSLLTVAAGMFYLGKYVGVKKERMRSNDPSASGNSSYRLLGA